MGEFQLVGTTQKLKSEPTPSFPSTGSNGNFQLVGTDVPLKDTPNKMSDFPMKSGEFQLVGSSVKLDKTPTVGWQAENSLASNRVKESK